MRSSLFRRLFLAFVCALLVTVLTFTGILFFSVGTQQRQAYEAELRLQARDVAQLMQSAESMTLWRVDPMDSSTFQWKVNEIQDAYNARIWIVYISGYVRMLGETASTEQPITSIAMNDALRQLLSGEEVRSVGTFAELGGGVLSIGVPWYSADGHFVMGGVLVHVDTSSIPVDYSSLLTFSLVGGLISMLIGTALSYLLARRQTRPIRAIREAVAAFAGGDFTARAPVTGSQELRELATAVNQMAQDLGNLEESRRSFVSSVSHELRSPMTCIQGYVEGMLDGTIPPEERGTYLKTVLSETQRLTKLVHDLLELSRFESGNFPLNRTVFDIDELILSVLFKYEQAIEKKSMLVDISFREQPLYVNADSDRIVQVLTNLIDNAVKYGAEGGQLTVRAEPEGGLARISIRNEGPSIPPEDLPFIFDGFYKVDKAHTSGKGTGLGLSIVKRIVEQHGQTITVSSAASLTTFTFTLEKSAPPTTENEVNS